VNTDVKGLKSEKDNVQQENAYVTQPINRLIRPQAKIKIWQFKWASEEQERQGYGTLTAGRN